MADPTLTPAILAPVVAYLSGSFLPADLVARRRGVRLRDADTNRNPGTAETFRLFGLRPAILVFVLDASKGALPVALAQELGVPMWSVILTALAAVAGHCWSLYYRFWGGMGLATAVGVYTLLIPLAVAVALPPSLFALWKTRWVPSTGVVGLPIILLIVWLRDGDPTHRAVVTLIPLLMLVRASGWLKEQVAARRAARIR